MSTEDATIEHYERSVPYYTLAFDSSHSRHLDAFLDRLSPGAHILELGCGTGRDAARMMERGFSVDATDGTSAMIRKARERHDVVARVMRFDELNADQMYDGVWAHACLMHAERADLRDIASRVYKALKSGGLHYASFKLGDGEGTDDRGRWMNEMPAEMIQGIYQSIGFAIAETINWTGRGADGVERAWHSVIARKK